MPVDLGAIPSLGQAPNILNAVEVGPVLDVKDDLNVEPLAILLKHSRLFVVDAGVVQ